MESDNGTGIFRKQPLKRFGELRARADAAYTFELESRELAHT